MDKRRAACAAALTGAMLLSGCGSVFDREYLSVKDYEIQPPEAAAKDERVNVRNFAALKQALLNLVYAGETSGNITFDPSYEGDAVEDVASACWQVRTQDALCAYCVENIAYEINKLVTINEASIYISYSYFWENSREIKQLYYSSGIEKLLKEALAENKSKLTVLVTRSTCTPEEIQGYAADIYRRDPTITPREPVLTVSMFSGNGQQKLYEINIRYGLNDEELRTRMEALSGFDPFKDTETADMDEAGRAYTACMYLLNNCRLSDSFNENTAYSALIGKSANSEGIALAYVDLCNRLNVECEIVYGQRAWVDHCWNIIKIDGSYYHADVAAIMGGAGNNRFAVSDEQLWGDYRWDMDSYPKCERSFGADYIFSAGGEKEETEEEEKEK